MNVTNHVITNHAITTAHVLVISMTPMTINASVQLVLKVKTVKPVQFAVETHVRVDCVFLMLPIVGKHACVLMEELVLAVKKVWFYFLQHTHFSP